MITPALPKVDFNDLVDALVVALDPVRLEERVTSCQKYIHVITPPVPMGLLTQRVLTNAQVDSWLGNLLDVIAGHADTGPTLRDQCRKARGIWDNAVRAVQALAPAGRPSAALVLFNRAPLVNRVSERTLIDDVVSFNGRRVLVVRGEKDVGKSHLEQFARHLTHYLPTTRMATLRMEDIDGTIIDDKGAAVVGAIDLMGALVSRMGLAQDPGWDALAQEQRQAGKLVAWLIGHTQAFAATQVQWVIAIDSANHPKAGPGALELIERLIMAAARGELINTCLLVLALPKEVPPMVANDVDERTLLPLTSTEVRTFIADLTAALGRVPDPVALAAMETYALDGLPFPLNRSGMDTLRQRLARLHDEILRAAA